MLVNAGFIWGCKKYDGLSIRAFVTLHAESLPCRGIKGYGE
jgi:hypothetical protein